MDKQSPCEKTNRECNDSSNRLSVTLSMHEKQKDSKVKNKIECSRPDMQVLSSTAEEKSIESTYSTLVQSWIFHDPNHMKNLMI